MAMIKSLFGEDFSFGTTTGLRIENIGVSLLT
jgi:hypothetical protein